MPSSVDASKVPETVKQLRESFFTGKTLTREWRLGQLNAMMRMVTEGRTKLCRALNEDLHKSMAEGYFTEVNLVEQEIQHAIDSLDRWMAPTSVPTNVLNLPGSSYLHKDPLGVVLIIGAWNYPVQLSLLPMVGAIAAGNCVVLKVPSEHYSAHASRAVAELVGGYMDPACVAVCEGDRAMTQAVLGERWDKIFFTGGSAVGKMVAEAAAKTLTPVTLELGGKSPAIVDRTADLKVAAMRFSWGAYMNAGQTCVRPDYLLVHADVADAFVGEVGAAVAKMFSKDPKSTEWFGRLINKRAHQRVAGVLNADKAFIRFGGEVDETERYVAPTLLDFGKDTAKFTSSASMADEIFAPVVPLLRYTSLDWVIQFIKSNEKPLACYLFTTDPVVQSRVLRETSSGCCVINDTMMQMSNACLPFGGVGKSGMGCYHGDYSFDCFTHKKSVLQRPFILDAPIRYPPYTNLSIKILEFLQAPKPALWLSVAKVVLLGMVVALALRSRPQLAKVLSLVANSLQSLAQSLA